MFKLAMPTKQTSETNTSTLPSKNRSSRDTLAASQEVSMKGFKDPHFGNPYARMYELAATQKK